MKKKNNEWKNIVFMAHSKFVKKKNNIFLQDTRLKMRCIVPEIECKVIINKKWLNQLFFPALTT